MGPLDSQSGRTWELPMSQWRYVSANGKPTANLSSANGKKFCQAVQKLWGSSQESVRGCKRSSNEGLGKRYHLCKLWGKR